MRDAWAAAILDTSFATIGLVRNRATTRDDMRTPTAVALDALSILVVAIGWAREAVRGMSVCILPLSQTTSAERARSARSKASVNRISSPRLVSSILLVA
jgi:hypothetical protein